MTYPTIDVMRRDISKVYSGEAWKTRVKHMPDGQVFAIWNKFCDEGRFNNNSKSCNSRTNERAELKTRKTIHSIEDKIKENLEKRVDPVVADEDYYCEQLAFDI
jgi:hypothetical protein